MHLSPGKPAILVGEELGHAAMKHEPSWFAVASDVAAEGGDGPERIVCGGVGG
jgi:hypothetical protein